MGKNMYELIMKEQQKGEIQQILSCNDKIERFGIRLTLEDAQELAICRHDALREQRRVEFGEGILPELIQAFCDSQYVEQKNFPEIIAQLQGVFYLYKNESEDILSDDELISFMKEQFEGVCHGSVEYLCETCLERFTRAIRAGYRNNGKRQDEYGSFIEDEYSQFSEESHWNKKMYFAALEELES
ncbi:MAG: DUF6323 family protein [Lachnospiraceae bacterium]